jgi:hypothetical protein
MLRNDSLKLIFFLLKRESEECLNKPLHVIEGLDGNKSAKARTLMRY